MSMDDKYKMFKQFMYNELGITKEDIEKWCKEAVMEVATNYVENQFAVRNLNLRLHDIITGTPYGFHTKKDLEYSVKNVVARQLADQFEIVLREKPDGD